MTDRWLALLPHSEEAPGSNPPAGTSVELSPCACVGSPWVRLICNSKLAVGVITSVNGSNHYLPPTDQKLDKWKERWMDGQVLHGCCNSCCKLIQSNSSLSLIIWL